MTHLGPGVSLDLARLVDTRMLIQASSGAGKSWCLRRLLEQTHGKVQQLVIDPEGEFASLREKFDYVLAAKHGGETSAEPRAAKLLAERLLELNVSAILDIYELKAHERVSFVKQFLEALIDAPKSLWHPALVVLDEAHLYCPEKGQAESAGPVIDLATRGRKRGYCAILATQRLAKLHKDAAAELNNKLIGRTGLDVDMKRAADELGFSSRAELLTLRDLDDGEFFAFGPALSKTVTRVQIGSVQTTHPKAGGRRTFTAPAPTAKIKALLPQLADLPAEAEARHRSIEDLRKENATLKREVTLAKKAQPAAPIVKSERIEVSVLKTAHVDRLERAVAQIGKAGESFSTLSRDLLTALAKVTRNGHSHPPPIVRPVVLPRVVVRPSKSVTPPREDDGELTGPERRILDACAWLHALEIDAPEQPAVAFLAGYTYNGGAFNNPRGVLRSKGLVEYVGGDRLKLTEAGRSVAHWPDEALTPEELQRRVLERLDGPQGKILRVLLEHYPDPIANDDCAREAGYEPNGGAFNNPRGRLRSLGLIEYPSPGYVVARSILFLEPA